MHFLFVYPSPGILGGIETLIARMSRWLVRNGHQVTLLVKDNKHWASLLPKETRCVALGERFRELDYYFHAKRLLDSLGIAKPDVIKSFDIPSAWCASQLATATGNDCKVLAGVYNPYLFKHQYAPKTLSFWDAETLYMKNFLESVPETARLFCGVDQIDELEQVHRQTGVLWPLPIDEKEFDPAPR